MVSIAVEHVESWKPKVGIGPGALARANSYTTDAAEIVEINIDKGSPFVIPTPPLDGNVAELRNFFISSADRISNIHEVSYARLPQYASRAPASLYSMMLEQESVKLDAMVKRDNKTLLRAAKFRLKMMNKNYSQARMVKTIGVDKVIQIRFFKGADLNSNFDVQLEAGISLNQSTSMTNRILMELWDKGALGNKDPKKLLKLMKLGISNLDLDLGLADDERASRENLAFIEGTWKGIKGKMRPVWVFIHDNHTTHLETHTDLMKTRQVDAWPDDQVKALQDHIDEHYKFFLQLQKASQPPPANEAGQVNASPDMMGGGEMTSDQGLSPETQGEQVPPETGQPGMAQ
jgi:hypothetical protein